MRSGRLPLDKAFLSTPMNGGRQQKRRYRRSRVGGRSREHIRHRRTSKRPYRGGAPAPVSAGDDAAAATVSAGDDAAAAKETFSNKLKAATKSYVTKNSIGIRDATANYFRAIKHIFKRTFYDSATILANLIPGFENRQLEKIKMNIEPIVQLLNKLIALGILKQTHFVTKGKNTENNAIEIKHKGKTIQNAIIFEAYNMTDEKIEQCVLFWDFIQSFVVKKVEKSVVSGKNTFTTSDVTVTSEESGEI